MKLTVSSAALALSLLASSAWADGALVVSSDSSIGSVDESTVSRLFLGRASEIDGVAVTLINQDEGEDIRTEFENEVLGKTGARLRSYWSRLVFTGKAQPPEEVGGDADVKAYLADNPDAVGYISAGSVDSSVKVIFEF
jgi:ABC-type phosphate transport system substrate-binding protein